MSESETILCEALRRNRVMEINRQVESLDPATERLRLKAMHGQVWTLSELASEFEIIDFMAPLAVVRRKADRKLGSVEFQHHPRFYFNWEEHRP